MTAGTKAAGRARAVSLFLCAILAFSPPLSAPASAGREYTRETAVAFARSLQGRRLDVDNGSYDCVDVAKEYFKVVGGKEYTSLTSLCGSPSAFHYAYPESDGAIPDGWTRRSYAEGYRPQPGDVAVWGAGVGSAGADGHVAVVVEITDGGGIVVVGQDSSKQTPAAYSAPIPADVPTCYIVPPFNQGPPEPVRYTVLLLDVSGPQTFEEKPNWMNLFGTKYTSDSSIEAVKGAAQRFLDDARNAVGINYISIVTYDEEARVAAPFTKDVDELQSALDTVEYVESNRSIQCGLECARELLNGVDGENVTKNLLICTTGLTDCGEYAYEGRYGEETVASGWQNMGTEVRLYAYANTAMESADRIKEGGTTVYVLGIFDPIEAKIPSSSGVKDCARFFRLTALDLASSEDCFFAVSDVGSLDFVFGELQDDLAGSAAKRLYNNSGGYAPDAPGAAQDEAGGALGLGGHYEEFLWGPALFETPASRVCEQDIRAGESANRNLAVLCGSLCAASYDEAYLRQAYLDLGFAEGNVFFYSYPGSALNRPEAKRGNSLFADDAELAFSIASREMTVGGEKCDLLAITLRGTSETWEAVKDATCLADKDFYDYVAWDWVYEFEEDVFAGLEDYHSEHPELGARPLKILVTGHSLGGAGANLVAAKLNLECGKDPWYARNTTADDVYAYTFGAIDSISKAATYADRSKPDVEVPVTEGFRNIVNVYNYLDTFGPLGEGVFRIPIIGSGTSIVFTAAGHMMYEKFGVFFTFADDMAGRVNPDSLWPTHEIAGYLCALRDEEAYYGRGTNRIRVCIRCPVDVEIYEGGALVCRIAGDEVALAPPDFALCVENGAKTLLLPEARDYRIALSATGAGEMTYTVRSLDAGETRAAAYASVALEPGRQMSSEIRGGALESVELFVVDEAGVPIARVGSDGSEEPIAPEPEPEPEPKPAPSPEPPAPAAAQPEAEPERRLDRDRLLLLAGIAAIVAALGIAAALACRGLSRRSAGRLPGLCPKCGAAAAPEDIFCGKCGARLDGARAGPKKRKNAPDGK